MSELPELFLSHLPFSHVPAEEEMFLFGFRPYARPRQRNYSPVFVNIPRFKVTRVLTLAGELHFVTRTFEIFGIDEFRATMPDHFLRPVADGWQGAGTYANKYSATIGDQDQIQRCLKQPPPLFRLLVQSLRLLVYIRIGVRAFFRGRRKPSQHEEAEHGAGRDDVHQLRKYKVDRTTQHSDNGGRKQTVLTAKVQTEIQVLDDVPNGVDHDDGQQQADRTKGPGVANERHAHRRQDGEPECNDDPVNQCGSKAHSKDCL